MRYEAEHHRKAALVEEADYFGTIVISYNTDLSEIRSQISKLLEEGDENTDKTQEQESPKDLQGCIKISNWWFLDSCSGDKFFRIDEAQEHLYYVNHICDEELYITEQREITYDVENDVRKVEPYGDDVSRISTSSSSRQSQESGDDRYVEDTSADATPEATTDSGEPDPMPPELLSESDTGDSQELENDANFDHDINYAIQMEEPEKDYDGDENIDDPTGKNGQTAVGEEKSGINEDEIFRSIAEARRLSTLFEEKDLDLITAAKLGNLNRVAKLQAEGNNLMERDHEGRTALHHAAFIGNVDMVRYLAAYAPIQMLDAQDDIMFHTALHRAATKRDKVTCSILVSAGAALDIKDKQGYTAQQLAEIVEDKKLAEYLESVANSVTL